MISSDFHFFQNIFFGLIELLNLSFLLTAESPINVTLSIVREKGSSGEVKIHYQTSLALYHPPSNQATAGQDYISRDSTVIMTDGATVAIVTVAILPVRRKSFLLINKKFTKSRF